MSLFQSFDPMIRSFYARFQPVLERALLPPPSTTKPSMPMSAQPSIPAPRTSMFDTIALPGAANCTSLFDVVAPPRVANCTSLLEIVAPPGAANCSYLFDIIAPPGAANRTSLFDIVASPSAANCTSLFHRVRQSVPPCSI